jgi:hypothetical protein
MRVDVVEQRALRLQTERYRQAAAERLDQPPVRSARHSGSRRGTCHRFPPAHFKGGRITAPRVYKLLR